MGKKTYTVGEILGMRPIPLAQWEERDERIILKRPVPSEPGLRGLLRRAAALLSSPTIALDATGSWVWRRMDGRVTVAELAQALAQEQQEPSAPERLALFVHQLARHGMLRLE